MALPYGEACKQGPRAAHDSGPRRAKDIKWAVIHTAEAADLSGADNTAEGVANFFANPSTQASTQLAVDRDSCVRMLPDLVIPWGASGANTNGVHVEICGRAAWTREQWLANNLHPMLERTAFKVAMWCYHYAIPTAWVTSAGLKAGRKGLTTHKDVNDAFGKGSHWDPGPGFPKDTFLALVKKHLAAIKASRKT
jgi:hypothetical protein